MSEAGASQISRAPGGSTMRYRNHLFSVLALFKTPLPRLATVCGLVLELVQLFAIVCNVKMPPSGIIRGMAVPVYFTILPFWDSSYDVSLSFIPYTALFWALAVAVFVTCALLGLMYYLVVGQMGRRGLTLTKGLLFALTAPLFQPAMHAFLAVAMCTDYPRSIAAFKTTACFTESFYQSVVFAVATLAMTALCVMKFAVTVLTFDDLSSTSHIQGRAQHV